MNRTATLANPQQANQWLRALWADIKPRLLAGHRLVVTVKDEKRSAAQNNLLHALLSQIAAHVEWAGRKRDAETWKRLLTAAWMRANGESVEILPAIDGHGIDVVFRHTSKLTKAECADLITYIESWAVQQSVPLTDPALLAYTGETA